MAGDAAGALLLNAGVDVRLADRDRRDAQHVEDALQNDLLPALQL
jgi:hypothetical protein